MVSKWCERNSSIHSYGYAIITIIIAITLTISTGPGKTLSMVPKGLWNPRGQPLGGLKTANAALPTWGGKIESCKAQTAGIQPSACSFSCCALVALVSLSWTMLSMLRFMCVELRADIGMPQDWGDSSGGFRAKPRAPSACGNARAPARDQYLGQNQIGASEVSAKCPLMLPR